MDRLRKIGWMLLVLLLSGAAVADEPVEQYLEEARGYAGLLLSDTTKVRRYEISLLGHVDTIHVCNQTAAGIAHEISCKNNILIRRVSPTPRNIGLSSLDQWEQQGFSQMVAGVSEFYAVTQEPAGRFFRYMQPIHLLAECLPCHGAEQQMSPAVIDELNKHYPYDGARNHAVGTLMGAISVKMQLE